MAAGDNEERFHALAEAAFDGLFVLDGVTILYANAAGLELFGYQGDELVGRDALELSAPESRPLVTAAIRSGQLGAYEAIGLRKDGSRFPGEIRGRTFHIGGQLRRVTAIRDLTARRQVEAALAANQADAVSLLRATLESTVEGIIVVDLDMHVRAYNRRFLEVWRIPETLAEGRDDDQLRNYAADQLTDPNAFLDGVREIYQQPGIETFDVLELTDGRLLERASRPQRLGDRIVGRVWSFRDVTATREVEAERDRSYHEAREAVRQRDEFLSIASHELYTPLCSLTLTLETLRGVPGAAALEEPQRQRLSAVAERQTARLAALVNTLLDVSRIESGRLELTREELDLTELVDEVVVERFAPDLVRAGSTLTMAAPTPVRGFWDRSRIDQVVSNLVANAIKYGAGRPIEVSVGQDGQGACLRVTDHGMGIDPTQLPRLFERFARAASARHFGGLGLGLYIARRAVEAHGGTIRVDSALGQGSTFVVRLPAGRP